MPFEFKQGEPAPSGIRRIVRQRIDQALKILPHGRAAVKDDSIHEVRKRLKEIRAILRLVRKELGDDTYKREAQILREAGRPLAKVRDAKVLVDSLDTLIAHFERRLKSASVAQLRQSLIERRNELRKQVIQRDRAIGGIGRRIRAARKRIDQWRLQKRGWKAIGRGLKAAYDRGRRAMEGVSAKATDAALHEWRKRAKDLRYAMELLQCASPALGKSLVKRAHELTDLLGNDHDLAVLRQIARHEFKKHASAEHKLLFAAIDDRRAALQKQAIAVGGKIYKHKPRDFVRGLKRDWKTARRRSTRD